MYGNLFPFHKFAKTVGVRTSYSNTSFSKKNFQIFLTFLYYNGSVTTIKFRVV